MFKALFPRSAGIRRPGSAALDLAFVAAGRLDGFWESGLNIWDMAAGVLLIQEAWTDEMRDGLRRAGEDAGFEVALASRQSGGGLLVIDGRVLEVSAEENVGRTKVGIEMMFSLSALIMCLSPTLVALPSTAGYFLYWGVAMVGVSVLIWVRARV